ncbi:hypothetical protein DAI22_02g321700 [Oryza sativa Japonica Group]|nr:hypothetical protein DAI22_02g321700 [Oryza sativa Japonica Group]
MAATACSTAPLLGGARLPAVGAALPPPSVLLLPQRNFPSPLRLHDAPRLSLLRARASSDDTSSSAATGDELIEDLKAKWDAVENKSTVLTYAGGAIIALWLSSVIVGAVNSVPLVRLHYIAPVNFVSVLVEQCSKFTCMWICYLLQLPKFMELVGLGYTGWFVYRYLLFKESRKELADDVDSLKKRIAGTE